MNEEKPKRDIDSIIKDFFIPRSFIDVLFIIIVIILAYYALTYEIPKEMTRVRCYQYWLEQVCPCVFSNQSWIDPYINKNLTP